MIPWRIVSATLLLTAILAPTPAAHATALQQQSFGVWKAEDKCAQAAFKKFPDYTADSNRAREVYYQRCVNGGQLPPRASMPDEGATANPPSDSR